MVESKKAASLSANQKDKSSLLDEEIGEDFLSSWKSMSVMEDDGMHFSFDAVPKGKKKAFDFDTLDMDFDRDGHFNKFSPGKVDMSYLDFSSPPRIAAKTKEISEEEPSSGSRQGKQDQFKTSFDFNDSDNFDFDSSLMKTNKSSKKNPDSTKEIISDKAESESSKACLAEDIRPLGDDTQRVCTSKVDGNDNGASKPDTSENLELPYCPRSSRKEMTESVEERDQLSRSPEKAIPTEKHANQPAKEMTRRTDESGQRSHSLERAMPKEPYAKQATKEMTNCAQETSKQNSLSKKALVTGLYAKKATHGLAGKNVGGVDSTRNTVNEGKNEGCPHLIKVNTMCSGYADANDKMSIGDGPNHEDSLLEDSSSLNISSSGSCSGDSSKSGGDAFTQNSEPATEDLDPEESSNAFVSRKSPANIKTIKEDQHSTSKIPLAMRGSESTVDKVAMTNESNTGEFHEKISKISEEAGSHMSQPSLAGGKCLSSGMKRIGTIHQRPAILQREGCNSDGLPSREKLVGSSLFDKKVTEREPFHGTEQGKDLNDLRFIFVGVETRATHATVGEASIVDDCEEKLVRITYNIVGSIAGYSQECKDMLHHVRKKMGEASDVHDAMTHAYNYITAWEFLNPGQTFPSSSLIAGFARDETAWVYHVSSTWSEPMSTDWSLYAIGSGGPIATDHCAKFQWSVNNSKEEALTMMKESLVSASLLDPSSGGWIHLYEVRPHGCSERVYFKEVLAVLAENHGVFSERLSKSLVTIWYNVYHEYNPANDVSIKNHIAARQVQDYHVVAIKRTCTIRLIKYADETSAVAAYQELWDDYQQWMALGPSLNGYDLLKLRIPHEVLLLPWFLHNLQPVIFAKPTRQMLELLVDV